MSAAAEVLCRICNKRRPKRFCPGVGGDICAICCGTEREVTVTCPFECPFLREARLRDPEPDIDPRKFPHPEIKIDEGFLQKNEALLLLTAGALAKAAINTEGAIDYDVRESLESLVRTYLTTQSGLIYESRPANILAARIHAAVQERMSEFRERIPQIRDAEVLGVLAFLQRLEIQHNNERPRGRRFIDRMREFFPPMAAQESGNLVVP